MNVDTYIIIFACYCEIDGYLYVDLEDWNPIKEKRQKTFQSMEEAAEVAKAMRDAEIEEAEQEGYLPNEISREDEADSWFVGYGYHRYLWTIKHIIS